MRFLVDECAGPSLARWLRAEGHDVFSIYDDARGMDDQSVIAKANAERRILITGDKDFGDIVFRQKLAHHGVILLRLKDERSKTKIAALERILLLYPNRLVDEFVVVSETNIRFSRSG